jgi:hypothetical protein
MSITLFDWLDNITLRKQDWDSFSTDDKESFNPYIIHRFVSMYEPYVDLVNIAQKIPYTEKEKTYLIYKSMLPKKKIFFKYIKSSKKNSNADLIIKLADYFSCSLGEAEEYSTLLKKEDVENILSRLGVNEKESKKLVKDLK